MLSTTQSTATIRQRGLLTIPDPIREAVDWASVGSVVAITQAKKDQIIISPYIPPLRSVNWNKVWRNIEIARSQKGNSPISLSRFINSDRENRG